MNIYKEVLYESYMVMISKGFGGKGYELPKRSKKDRKKRPKLSTVKTNPNDAPAQKSFPQTKRSIEEYIGILGDPILEYSPGFYGEFYVDV